LEPGIPGPTCMSRYRGAGLITRRSRVQILPPLPRKVPHTRDFSLAGIVISTAPALRVVLRANGSSPSHAGGRWFDPSRAHFRLRWHAVFAQPCGARVAICAIRALSGPPVGPCCAGGIAQPEDLRRNPFTRSPRKGILMIDEHDPELLDALGAV